MEKMIHMNVFSSVRQQELYTDTIKEEFVCLGLTVILYQERSTMPMKSQVPVFRYVPKLYGLMKIHGHASVTVIL